MCQSPSRIPAPSELDLVDADAARFVLDADVEKISDVVECFVTHVSITTVEPDFAISRSRFL